MITKNDFLQPTHPVRRFIHQIAYHLHNLHHARSPHWSVVRRAWLRAHPRCANPLCGSVEKVEVHHKKPFHLFPGLELLPANFITLCMGPNECHLKIGHLGNWQKYNAMIDKTIERLTEEAHAQRV